MMPNSHLGTATFAAVDGSAQGAEAIPAGIDSVLETSVAMDHVGLAGKDSLAHAASDLPTTAQTYSPMAPVDAAHPVTFSDAREES